MKKAFTMIELIFVIVILGILSAVALPKYFGTAKSADAAICKAFVGSLNRTVSHSIWADSILTDPNDFVITEDKLAANVSEQASCGTLAQYANATLGSSSSFEVTIGSDKYDIEGSTADSTGPAQWSWNKQ